MQPTTEIRHQRSYIPRPLQIMTLLTFNLSLLILLFACPQPPDENDPPLRNTDISLELVDTWTRSITLKAIVEDPTQSWGVILMRDDSIILETEVFDTDTTVVDYGLPAQTAFTYQAFFTEDSLILDSSAVVGATTLDSSSHAMDWTVQTLGIEGVLRDAWIVDENDIWVVGQIIMDDPDSSFNGTGRETFNAAHWNGSEWEMLRLSYGQPLEGIFVFNENDIWVASGVPCHWDGQEWTNYHLWNMGVLSEEDGGVPHIWGASPDDIYFVGRKGSIVHYDGVEFVKLESGTDINLTDIWGLDENDIWIVGGSTTIQPWGGVMLHYDGISMREIYQFHWPEDSGSPSEASTRAIWTDNEKYLYATGYSGQHIYDNRRNYFHKEESPNVWVHNKIRGSAENDVFSVGAGSEVVHYNGSTYYLHQELKEVGWGYTLWRGLDVSENLVVVVGDVAYNYAPHAYVAIGARN